MGELLDLAVGTGVAIYAIDKLTGKRKRIIKNPPKKRLSTIRKRKNR